MRLLELFDQLMEDDRQHDLELLARLFLEHFITRCMRYLPDHLGELQSDPDSLYRFPGAVLGDMFPNGRGLRRFSQSVQNFIKANKTLRLGVEMKHGTTRGYYRASTVAKEIILLFDQARYAQFLASLRQGLREHALRALLQTRLSTLVHELQHAYDDWASAGKFHLNQRTMAARVYGLDAQTKHARYLNDPVEISARYRHTVSEINPRTAWKDYLNTFRWKFDGWQNLPPEDQRRLTQRLARYWLTHRPPQTRDIGSEVKQLQDKLRDKYGSVWLSYTPYRNAISVDTYQVKDRAAKLAILQDVMRFADVRRAVVATDDLKYSPAMRQLGFINQRSNKRDYALPTATTMYRPARPSMQQTA